MPDSHRERIFAKIKENLATVDGIGQVIRGKIDALSIQVYPAVFILPGADQVTDYLGDRIDRDMQLFLFMWFRAEQNLHQMLEAQLPKVQAKMAADHTLSGLTIDVTEIALDAPFPLNEEQTEAGIVGEWNVKYRVLRTDPYS